MTESLGEFPRPWVIAAVNQARCTCGWAGPKRPYQEHGKCDADAGRHLIETRDANCESWIEARDA